MKFFVDTADIAEIRDLADTGLLDGVTTNPSLIKKSGREFKATIAEICAITDGPVSAEVVATDYEGMVRQGEDLRKIADNVCIKVPLTIDGLKACKHFTSSGTQVNVTLCFSAGQALLAAKAGATFISPFVGRLDDIATDGMLEGPNFAELEKMLSILTCNLVASGGVSCADDLRRLNTMPGLYGAIIGKALYDGRITGDLRAIFQSAS